VEASPVAAAPRRSGLDACFKPRTVAVIGAGRSAGVGASILRNLLATQRAGVYPVNPHARSLDGVACYPTLADVPASIDLAVIAVPAAAVAPAVDDCIRAQVGAIVVISAGFGETGSGGRRREADLRERVRQAGIRMIGPNCLGLISTDPDTPVNASFAPSMPPAGPVAFASQSGALGLAVVDAADRLGVGLSSFVSTGNAADVSFADLLEYWESDARTTAILLYAESFTDPQRFAAVARRVSRTKPVVVLKSGRSAAGAKAASSHTGALAQQDALVDALLRDAGVLRVGSLEELFATAALLARQPLPRGTRVAVLTNAGGPGIVAADAAEASGLTMATLSPRTTEILREFLPANAGLGNPIDMIATASPDDYRRAVPLLLADPGVDALLTMFIPLSVTNTTEVATALAAAARGADKPVLTTFFGTPGVASLVSSIPCYDFPETAIRALAAACACQQRRLEPQPAPEPKRLNPHGVRPMVARARATGTAWLDARDATALLEASGITVAPHEFVTDTPQAVAAARRFGYPVVVKGSGPTLLHKTERHAVHRDLQDERSVAWAFEDLSTQPGVTTIVVQPMIRAGVEMLVGAVWHREFGHAVVCGSGGTLVELMQDTALRLAPVTRHGVETMLNELRGIRLLRGYRGAPVLDETALVDTVLRISELVDVCPEIAELDLNPVIVTATGAVTVDARIRIE
jgi:acetyl coenzyme A synthetase (ADP forming)-like protein